MIRKTVIITGASGDIGGACALDLAKNGYNVALIYNTSSTKALAKKIEKLGVEYKEYKIDVKDEKEVQNVFEKIFSDFDCVEGLVCCAGVAEKEDLLINKTPDQIKDVIDTNLYGSILCNREACKYFIKRKRGAIVNISSILGKVGCSCEVAYSASKAGVIGLTKALSKEVGEFGIRVNAVAPGMIRTKMTKDFTQTEFESIMENSSLRRIGEPEDVANVVAFLIGEQSNFVTGECIEVSGGMTI